MRFVIILIKLLGPYVCMYVFINTLFNALYFCHEHVVCCSCIFLHVTQCMDFALGFIWIV